MFRRGTLEFNEDPNFNFQLNRLVMWGNGDPKEPSSRSLALQMYTNQDDAGSHCNIGNMKLAMDTMISWILLIDGKNAAGTQ